MKVYSTPIVYSSVKLYLNSNKTSSFEDNLFFSRVDYLPDVFNLYTYKNSWIYSQGYIIQLIGDK